MADTGWAETKGTGVVVDVEDRQIWKLSDVFLRTSDGGTSWQPAEPPHDLLGYPIHFIPPQSAEGRHPDVTDRGTDCCEISNSTKRRTVA